MFKETDAIESKPRGWLPTSLIMTVMALLLGFVIGNASGAAFAQATPPVAAPDTQSVLAQAAPTRDVTPDEVNTVARQLWCPLCSGVRLDACELKACEQMKEVIAIKLAEGENTENIQAYFVEQYGPQVMGEPPREGFNWLAWILPGVVLVMGGLLFWRTTKRMMRPAMLLEAEGELEPNTTASASQSSPATRLAMGDEAADEDEYTQKLDEELAKYG